MTDYIPNLPDKIPIEDIPRMYDMNSPVPVAEYVDADTGVRLTVKGDVLGHYTYDLFWTEGDEIDNKEISEVIRRLMIRAGLIKEMIEVYDPSTKQMIQAIRTPDGGVILEQ